MGDSSPVPSAGDQTGLLHAGHTNDNEIRSDFERISSNHHGSQNEFSRACCQRSVMSLVDAATSDVVSYLNEYGGLYDAVFTSDEEKAGVNQHELDILAKVQQKDVVIFIKHGCGYCERAKKLLRESQQVLGFSIEEIVGTEPPQLKQALARLLKLSDFTYPQIIVNGVYVGGADDLAQWMLGDGDGAACRQDRFEELLRRPKPSPNAATVPSAIAIPWYPPLARQAAVPLLFKVPLMARGTSGAWYPRDWPWYAFQWCMYANLVRYISFLQIAIMLPAALLYASCADSSCDESSTTLTVASVLVTVLLVDVAALVLHAPSPFSPTGLVSTYFGWRTRGNVTSAVPYKVVWLFYGVTLAPLLARNDHKAVAAALIGFVINSTILVVVRF